MRRTIAIQAATFSSCTVKHSAWQLLWKLGAALDRAFSAFVNFWNIPMLGADETDESRYFRTGRYI